MKITKGISSAAVLLLLLGSSAPIYSQSGRQRERQERRGDQSKRMQQAEADRNAQAENQRARQQQAQQQRAGQAARDRQQQDSERQQRQQAQAEQRMRQQQEQRAQQDRAHQQHQEQAQRREQDRIQQDRARQQQQQQREQERFQQDRERQQREQERRQQQERELQARVKPPQGRPPGWDEGKKVGWGGADVPPGQRLSEQRQRELIEHNRRQQEQFRQRFDNDLRRGEEQGRFLQQLHRLQQYRYQQEYLEQLRRQQARIRNQRNYDYGGDGFFSTVANYRYNRGGRNYETNQYGINLIQQALNHGYEQGFRAGRADRLDRWRYDFRNSYAYGDANYGYDGFYVNQSEYNYYFREGFRRGYEDGYYSRSQYGRFSNNRYSLLDNILQGIFIAVRFR